MIDEDLNAPLGQFPVRKRPSLGNVSYIAVAFGGLGMLGALAAFVPGLGSQLFPEPAALHNSASRETAFHDAAPNKTQASPKGALAPQSVAGISGEASMPLPGPSVHGPLVPSAPVTDLDQAARQGAEAIERESGVKIVRPAGGAAPGALIIDVAKALNTGFAAAPDSRLIEQTQYGLVPRIGTDGARPAEIYARPAVSLPGLPRIALLVSGLGLSPRATEAAIAGLPGAVTLGFAPYGTGLARQTTRAREAGHELILQIPMEPFDFPRDNPGPHTLTVDLGKAANNDNLTWLMSRFTGYAGVANFLGGKFTSDEKALTPVLRMIAARGLFYIDDGTSARSLAMALSPGHSLSAARADIVLDLTPGTDAIDAALTRLEAIARDKGLAIGVASALPESVEAIGRFARTLEARGIALVPLSAAMPRLQQSLADQQP